MNQEVVKIEKIDIICPFENNEQYVAVKPVCELLGISHQAQFKRIQQDKILNSVVMQCMTTGADNKVYDMTCLPLRYVFGWLFSIDPEKVKPEVKESVIKYQRLCYDTLYDHFMGPIAQRKKELSRKLDIISRKRELEKVLAQNPEYVEYVGLAAEEMRIGKTLKENDQLIAGTQMKLFEDTK